MPYINVYSCVNCNKELSNHQLMYSDGRCPLCGHKAVSACTIVKCNESFRLVENTFTEFVTEKYQSIHFSSVS